MRPDPFVTAPERLYLGLISGTSADGIDAALVRFSPQPIVVAARSVPYPATLRSDLLALTAADATIGIDAWGALDHAVGACFADAALGLLEASGIAREAVHAIGSHGQTVRHRPGGPAPFTLQIGDASLIAERTGITTVADFRRADLAAGGQGAPLVPAFHAAAFAALTPCVVLNLGGIANISVLRADGDVLGFDTGPANGLLDAWIGRHHGANHDADGAWARAGHVDEALLADLLADPYFAAPPPKSSGREHFNLDWLDRRLVGHTPRAVDVQATLVALSARSIADAIRAHAADARSLIVCGGGIHNTTLIDALRAALAPLPVRSSADCGLDPDHVEAAAFAWLARERLAGRPGNRPSVTGARGPRVLGAIYPAPI